MYLLDTSIILELLLDQEKADDVESFLRSNQAECLYLSEFSLYSLGIVLLRRKMHDSFLYVVNDLLLRGGIRLARLVLEDMQNIVRAARKFDLDFDDAYQCAVAEKYGLMIVSFDTDFDRTEPGRKTPTQILGEN